MVWDFYWHCGVSSIINRRTRSYYNEVLIYSSITKRSVSVSSISYNGCPIGISSVLLHRLSTNDTVGTVLASANVNSSVCSACLVSEGMNGGQYECNTPLPISYFDDADVGKILHLQGAVISEGKVNVSSAM